MCRIDEKFLATKGKRKAFHVGSNSSCRQHIRLHYEVYQERCVERGIAENHHAIPREVLRRRQEKEKSTRGVQMTLDAHVSGPGRSLSFSREAVLKAVAEFIVCDDQVWICLYYLLLRRELILATKSLMVADKATFRNCLVAMRPAATKLDLPSTHDVKLYVANAFTKFFQQLGPELRVILFFSLNHNLSNKLY